MSTRVSTLEITQSGLNAIQDAYSRFDTAQRKVSTGKQVQQPSDDPSGVSQSLDFRERIDEINQFGRTINQAKSFLSTTDTALSSVTDLVRQARTIGVQGANDGADSTTRNALASQVQNIITQVASIANTTYGGRYIFAGQRTTTAPFIAGPTGYSYVGGTQATGDSDLTLDIGRGESLKTNVTGDVAFSSLLTNLGKLRDDISNGSSVIVSQTDLTNVDGDLNNVLTIRADIGSKINRLDSTTSRNELDKQNYTQFISNIEDANIPSAVVDLQTAQTVYQAALSSTAKTYQNSLLDFIK